MKKKILLVLLLSPSFGYAANATFSFSNGWSETLENYPTDADVLNFANGRTDSQAENLTGGIEAVAGVSDFRFSRQRAAIMEPDTMKYTGQPRANCWQTIVPWEMISKRFALSLPFEAWATKPKANGRSAAMYATSRISNGHLVFIVQPALKERNEWWNQTAQILQPSTVLPVRGAAERYNKKAGVVPSVVRSYLDGGDMSLSLSRQITVYSQEGHAFTFLRGGATAATNNPYRFDPDAGVNGQTSGTALFSKFFAWDGAAGATVPVWTRGLRDIEGKAADGVAMFSFAASPTLPSSRGDGVGGVSWDPQGSLSGAYAFVNLRDGQNGTVGDFWKSGSNVISDTNGLYGDGRAPFKATFNFKAVPMEFFCDDPIQVQQGHRFGAYMFTQDWESNYRANFWSWSTEVPYNAHLFEREGFYRVVTVPVITLAEGSRPAGTDTHFTFDRNAHSYADWSQARVQEVLVAGCFEWAKVSYEILPVDPRDKIFLNTPEKTSGVVKIYKDNYGRRLRHEADPTAYFQDSEFNIHLDKKWEDLLAKGIVKLRVRRYFSADATGAQASVQDTVDLSLPNRTPLANGARLLDDAQDASRVVVKVPVSLLMASSPCRADKLPDAQSQPDMSDWASAWGYRQKTVQ